MSRIRGLTGARTWNPTRGQVRQSGAGNRFTLGDMWSLCNPPVPPKSLLTVETDLGGGAIYNESVVIPLRHRNLTVGHNPTSRDAQLCFSETEMATTRRRVSEFLHGPHGRKPPLSADVGESSGVPAVFEKETRDGTRYVFSQAHAEYRDRFLRVFPDLHALAEACAIVAGCAHHDTEREHWLRKLFGLDKRSLAEASEAVAAQHDAAQRVAQQREEDAANAHAVATVVESADQAASSSPALVAALQPPVESADWEADDVSVLDDDGAASPGSSSGGGDRAPVEAQYAAVYEAFAAYCRDEAPGVPAPDLSTVHIVSDTAARVRRRELVLTLAAERYHELPSVAAADGGSPTTAPMGGTRALTPVDTAHLQWLDNKLRTEKLHGAAVGEAVELSVGLQRRKGAGLAMAPPAASVHDRLSSPSTPN